MNYYLELLKMQAFGIAFVTLVGVFALRSMIIGGAFLLWKRLCATARRNPVIVRAQKALSLSEKLVPALTSLSLDAFFSLALIRLGIYRVSFESSSQATVIGIALLFVWLEIYFYYSHRLLHHPKLFWIHKLHHQEIATSVWTSLRFSVLERLVLLFGSLGVPALVSQFVVVPIEAPALYFLLNYTLNVFAHWNSEVTPSLLLRYRFFRILNTTTFHALHHLRFRGHYGLFTPFLDLLHGTQFPDYLEFQAERYEAAAKQLETSEKRPSTNVGREGARAQSHHEWP